MSNSTYWEQRWQKGETGWDLKSPSPPLCDYALQIEAGKRHLPILIPGCGNGHEALFLLKAGFSKVHMLDIAPTAVELLKQRLDAEFEGWQDRLQLHCADFFQFEGQFQYVLEQTFFCALDPQLRLDYFKKMHELIVPGGRLAGVWFNTNFAGGPPFGGDLVEYQQTFKPWFEELKAEACYNSIPPRAGAEVFMILTPKKQ